MLDEINFSFEGLVSSNIWKIRMFIHFWNVHSFFSYESWLHDRQEQFGIYVLDYPSLKLVFFPLLFYVVAYCSTTVQCGPQRGSMYYDAIGYSTA